jgi:hypothetical protein
MRAREGEGEGGEGQQEECEADPEHAAVYCGEGPKFVESAKWGENQTESTERGVKKQDGGRDALRSAGMDCCLMSGCRRQAPFAVADDLAGLEVDDVLGNIAQQIADAFEFAGRRGT